jgi:hypothetical protein
VIRVGVAGWDYDDWKGPVYPAPAPRGFDPLAWLSGWFDLVEINSTFYRPASARAVRSWLSRVEAPVTLFGPYGRALEPFAVPVTSPSSSRPCSEPRPAGSPS